MHPTLVMFVAIGCLWVVGRLHAGSAYLAGRLELDGLICCQLVLVTDDARHDFDDLGCRVAGLQFGQQGDQQLADCLQMFLDCFVFQSIADILGSFAQIRFLFLPPRLLPCLW